MVFTQTTRGTHRQTLSHNVVYVIYVNYITIWCLPRQHGETHRQTLSHNVVLRRGVVGASLCNKAC